MMRSAPGEHWSAFVFVFACAALLNFNFAWFREQLCIVICPYGRLQSALVDDNSLVIGYDAKRGEPRGHIRHDPAQHFGDCIACNRCVHVCPTGIDIRQGLQIECIGCAACIDACDEVMARTKRPAGLIRYDSLAGLAGGRTSWVRPRTILYGVLLLIGAAVATFAFSTVKPANFSVVRMTGAAYFVDSASVRNQFLVRLLNKRSDPMEMVITASGLPPEVQATGLGTPVTIAPMAEEMGPVVLTIDRGRYRGPFEFVVRAGDVRRTFEVQRKVQFLGPDPKLLQEEDREKGITR
jgi:cytochrome c oxidase accessory protein FixG